jgi:hypothetical protein
LIPNSGNLYVGNLPEEYKNFPVEFKEIGENNESGAKMDPKWSPDSKLVSFVQDGDIWITNLQGGCSMRITNSHALNKFKSAGVAEFIIQEEFDRYSGYWWSEVVEQISLNV